MGMLENVETNPICGDVACERRTIAQEEQGGYQWINRLANCCMDGYNDTYD